MNALVRYFFCLILTLNGVQLVHSQERFSRADTLRGTLSPARSCYDVSWYDLAVRIEPETRTVSGINRIHWQAEADFSEIQLDLDARMQVEGVRFEGKELPFRREENAFFVQLPGVQPKGSTGVWEVRFSGKPKISQMPPWDGGFVWEKDSSSGLYRVFVACEGEGASLWWPLKDHLSDEPDSMRIAVTVPAPLMAVSNGRLTDELPGPDGWDTYVWKVTQPINSYNVTLYVGEYSRLSQTFTNATGTHDLIYYVYPGNEKKALQHFRQVKPMLTCFEQHFGEYPFWVDSYKLVESSYWGMEHQSAIAYGNKYTNVPYGFDYIIIHESGHEWFGNSVSAADHADLWIHESFTTYAESVYIECQKGTDAAQKYLNGQRAAIANKTPMAGPYGVNYQAWGDNDIYYKGAWMLHTLRKTVNNDSLWHAALRDFPVRFRHTVTDTRAVTGYFSEALGMDLEPFFNQYLYHAALPVLHVTATTKKSTYVVDLRWEAQDERFGEVVPVYLETASGIRRVMVGTGNMRLSWKDKTKKGWSLKTDWGLYDVQFNTEN